MKNKFFSKTLSFYQATMISEALGCFVASQGEFLKPDVKQEFISLEREFDDLISSHTTCEEE